MAEATFNHLRVVVDPSVIGTSPAFRVRIYSDSWGFSDAQTVVITGDITQNVNYTASAPSGSSTLMFDQTFSRSGARGSTYSISVTVTGVYTSPGYGPTVGASVTVPALVPDACGAVSASGILSTQIDLTAGVPAANGAAIDGYEFRAALDAAFTSGLDVESDADNVHTMTGLIAGSIPYFAARAHNSVGWGPWGTAQQFRLLPGALASLVSAVVTAISARADWSAPPTTPSGYWLQMSTSPTFDTLLLDLDVGLVLTRALTGLTPATTYYVRVRAYNATGVGAWSTMSFTTLAGLWAWIDDAWVAVVALKEWHEGAWRTLTLKKYIGGGWRL